MPANTLYGADSVSGLSESFASKDVLGTDGSTLVVNHSTSESVHSLLSVNNGLSINDGTGGTDYTINFVNATGTITPASLTIAATSDSKVYDSTTTVLDGTTPTVSGLHGSDTVTGLSESFVSPNVLGTGNSTLVVNSGYTVNDGNSGNDYTVLPLVNAAGTITPASLTITATSDTKVYDGTVLDGATPTVSGLQGIDSVTGLSESFNPRTFWDRAIARWSSTPATPSMTAMAGTTTRSSPS